ncbi:MAG: hypothetical protein KF754_08130 [Planctomycetes bacterium]|nr:hypothetical protein [Planctomycetota bacterium]
MFLWIVDRWSRDLTARAGQFRCDADLGLVAVQDRDALKGGEVAGLAERCVPAIAAIVNVAAKAARVEEGVHCINFMRELCAKRGLPPFE